MIVIDGIMENIVYRNEKNSYTVARVSTEDGMLTVVGYFPFQPYGAKMKMSGDLIYHDKYGEQFKLKRILNSDTNYSNSMEAFLRSGAIAHIGPALAERIIKKFGNDTYDIFKNNPKRLLEVDGIGKKTYEKIMDSFNDQADLREVMIELANFGIGKNLGEKLFQKYGEGVIEVIKKNPYLLIDAGEGIGFKTADQIAKESGIENNNPNRIEAGLVYLLSQSINEGHCYLFYDELINKGIDYLKVTKEDIEKAKKEFMTNRNIKVVKERGDVRVYLNNLLSAENYISIKLNKLNKMSVYSPDSTIDSRIKMIEDIENITFGARQREAIKKAFSSRLLIITGGPGTGKTTTLKAILQIAEELGIKYSIAAPTGRAAKRMEEATGREAKTIHRLLEYQFNGSFMEFNKNENNPLDCEMFIIDEMSMVDTQLLCEFMRALKNNVRLVFLGDVNQIPSVGAGNVLKDMIDSSLINIVQLDKIFRQSGGSMIVDNAHRINQGLFPLINEKNSDFFMMASQNEYNTVELIKELVKDRLPNFYKLNPLEDIQIMAPMKKGIAGVENLNAELQKAMNPEDYSKEEIIFHDIIFRLGDKVMQTKNNYQVEWKAFTEDRIEYDSGLGIYNGDIGFISQIDKLDNTLTVSFDDKEVIYNEDTFGELTLAYAVTIHKSQGSEFPVVIIPVHYAPDILANRNLIYTAITRAKSLVVLVGKDTRLKSMIANTYINERHTGLKEKIQDLNRIIKDENEKEKLFNMRTTY